MRISGLRSVGALAVAAALAAAGCSSSGGSHTSSSAPVSAGSSAAGSSAASAPAGGAPSTGGKPADPATTKAVSAAYTTFFSPTSTVARSQAALQHGAAFHQVLAAESNSSQAGSIDVKVTKVALLRSDLALVTFTLRAGGIALPNTHGYAVRETGTWKVAAQTFCSLLQLQGNTPPPCKDPSITALPD